MAAVSHHEKVYTLPLKNHQKVYSLQNCRYKPAAINHIECIGSPKKVNWGTRRKEEAGQQAKPVMIV